MRRFHLDEAARNLKNGCLEATVHDEQWMERLVLECDEVLEVIWMAKKLYDYDASTGDTLGENTKKYLVKALEVLPYPIAVMNGHTLGRAGKPEKVEEE